LAFICTFLADSAGNYPALSPEKASLKKNVAPSGKPQTDIKPFVGYYKANMLPGIPSDCSDKIFNNFPAAAARLKPKVAAAPQSGQSVTKPFREYYIANMLPTFTAQSSFSASLFAKFPAAAERLKPKVMATKKFHTDIKSIPADALASIFAKFPAAVDRLKPKVTVGTSMKTGKFHTDIKNLPADALASIFAKFPAAADCLKPKVTAGTSVKTGKFHTDIKSIPGDALASIFAKFPAAVDRLKSKVPAGTSIEEAFNPSLAAFNQTASVGTWCVPIFRRTS